MREKLKGRPAVVSVGYKKTKSERKIILVVKNISEMEKIKKNDIVTLGKVGKKRKVEILKKAKEMGIKIFNLKVIKETTPKGVHRETSDTQKGTGEVSTKGNKIGGDKKWI